MLGESPTACDVLKKAFMSENGGILIIYEESFDDN